MPRLPRTQWPSYVDAYARGQARRGGVFYGEMRIIPAGGRGTLPPRWLPVRSIAYNDATNELRASVDHLGDVRRSPLDLLVDDPAPGVIRLEVSRSDGTDETIELR